jgi:molybdopterin/thiamine biosynthesis adenylyltransferase
MRVLMTSDFARAIHDHIAVFPPERMVHALGTVRPDGSVLLTHWVADAEADASGSHVRASGSAEKAIQELERAERVTYLGVIHSHPVGFPEPSDQDGVAVADLLRLNPHLPLALVGVVVSVRTSRSGRRVHDLGAGELVVYGMSAHGQGGAGLVPADLAVVDRDRDFYAGAARRLPRGAFDGMRGAHAAVIGCGSLGSVAAEQLVRAGVPRLTLIDPDRVEVHNLTRTVFGLDDVGRPKVDALADRLLAINPRVEVECHDWTVDPSAVDKLSAIIAESDVVLGMADSPKAMSIVDVLLHERDRPGVFAGVYRGAAGADIVTVLPGLTACYRCTVAPRVKSTGLQPGVDYSTGRIAGAVALGVDVTTVAVLVARVALGVVGLMRDTDPLMATAAFDGRNFLQLGLAPGFFDATGFFAGAQGQHAFQSIWAAAQGDPDCPECGDRALAPTPPAITQAGAHPLGGGWTRPFEPLLRGAAAVLSIRGLGAAGSAITAARRLLRRD